MGNAELKRGSDGMSSGDGGEHLSTVNLLLRWRNPLEMGTHGWLGDGQCSWSFLCLTDRSCTGKLLLLVGNQSVSFRLC